jgi:hypothetical protein
MFVGGYKASHVTTVAMQNGIDVKGLTDTEVLAALEDQIGYSDKDADGG